MKRIAANILILIALQGLVSCGALALGTASGTLVTGNATMDVFNATATTATTNSGVTVKAVYGLATSTFTEQAAKSVAPGATATYDFSIVNTGNATDGIAINIGSQSFSGTTGPPPEWAVAAERVGAGFLTFQNSGGATAAQTSDTATATAVPPGATLTIRLHNKTSPSAANSASTSYPVSLAATNFPGAAYTGFNGTRYAGPTSWSRQLDGGLVITSINGITLDATKTVVVTAPPSYVTNGGGASDPVPGSQVQFSITFTNTGGSAASGVVIQDTLPLSTTFKTGSILSCFTGNGCTPAADPDANGANPDCYFTAGAPGQIQCDVDSLAGGGGGTVKYTVIID